MQNPNLGRDMVMLSTPVNTPTTATALITPSPHQKVRVFAMDLIARGDVLARLTSGNGGDNLTGQHSMSQSTGWVWDYLFDGWIETNKGEPLTIELSAAVNVDGVIKYQLIQCE